MRTKIKTGLTAIVTLCALNFVAAQDQPKMPEALAGLMKLEGRWEGPATLTLEGKSHEFTYYANFKKTADGNGIAMDEWFTADIGAMKGSNLIGYNSNDEKIHWFSVDNFGTAHEHLGTWKSAEHFYMEANEVQSSKKFVEKIDMAMKGKDALELIIVATLDGQEFERGVVNFHRVKQRAEK